MSHKKNNINRNNKQNRKTEITLFFCLMLFVVASVMATRSVINISHEPYRYDDPDPKPALVEILNSDVLYKRSTDPRADILVGNVKIKHEGAFLNCDSARYYKDDNSFYAYGRVYLVQGDTLKLYCDTLDYYGNSMVAKARGRARLYHRNRRLETDKLEYRRLEGEAKYFEGGTIYQDDKVLYAYYGEYNTNTRLAVFTQDAKLKDRNNTVTCDVGQYNAETHITILKGNVRLVDNKGNVLTSDNGKYDSDQQYMQAWDNVKLVDTKGSIVTADNGKYETGRKFIQAWDNVRWTDKKNNVMTCDRGDYDSNTRLLRCFDNVHLVSKDGNDLVCDEGEYNENTEIAKGRGNMVLTDKDGGKLVCDHGTYNSNTHIADFYDNVRLNKPDGKGEVVTSHLIYNTDTEVATIDSETNILGKEGEFIYTTNGTYNTKTGAAELLGRSYIIKDERRIDGDKLRTYKQDETGYTVDEAVGNVQISDPVNQFGLVGDSCMRIEEIAYSKAFGNVIITDSVNKCHVLGHHCEYDEENGYAMATDSAEVIYYYYQDTVYVHSDTMKIFSYNINTDSVYRNLYAYHKVRMFRNDIQAVCDSLVHLQRDSCTYLFGQPIIWNMNQQVFGERINVYNNDSTVDWVHIINQAMTVEQVDSASFNQVQAKEMFAYFVNGQIEHSEAKGNVYVAYFLDEDDGNRIGMNYTETSELKMYMENKKMKKIWMPAGSGTLFSPLNIPNDKKYLPAFAWFDYIRPKNKDDVFEWRDKDAKNILQTTREKKVPLQTLDQVK